MAQLTVEEFEALWLDAQKGPAVREAAVQPIQLDMSLSGALDRYGTIADGFLAQAKISKVDHDTLMAAIAALKVVLIAINEKELIAQHVADATKTVQQQVQDKIATLLAAPGRPT
jgi:hypothetical protein